MLSEEKRTKTEQSPQRNSSILMSSQDITLLLHRVINSRGDLVSDSPKHVYDFFIKSQ